MDDQTWIDLVRITLAVTAIFVALFIYFAPSLVASKKKKKQATAIFVLNFLLGWTLLGWIAALVWAISED